jgi:hypothetical protein
MSKVRQSWKRFCRGVMGVVFLLFAGISLGTLQGCMGVPAQKFDDRDVEAPAPSECESSEAPGAPRGDDEDTKQTVPEGIFFVGRI